LRTKAFLVYETRHPCGHLRCCWYDGLYFLESLCVDTYLLVQSSINSHRLLLLPHSSTPSWNRRRMYKTPFQKLRYLHNTLRRVGLLLPKVLVYFDAVLRASRCHLSPLLLVFNLHIRIRHRFDVVSASSYSSSSDSHGTLKATCHGTRRGIHFTDALVRVEVFHSVILYTVLLKEIAAGGLDRVPKLAPSA